MAIQKAKMFTVDRIDMTVKPKGNLEFYVIANSLELHMDISNTKEPGAILTPI